MFRDLRRSVPLVLGLVCGAGRLDSARAQASWHVWRSVEGGLLGGGAGLVVGSLGSLLPCTETYAGPHCVRWVAGGAALLGVISGTLVGGRDPDVLSRLATGAAFGFGAGVIVGTAMAPFIERWAPEDALALGVIGGAAGSAPLGAVIGFGAGALSGIVLWRTRPDFGSPDAAAMVLGGIALGVLTEWTVRAMTTESGAAPVRLAFHVSF